MSILEKTPTPSFEATHSMAMQVYRHPGSFKIVKGGWQGKDIYVERQGRHDYDKHFWVTVDDVEMVRRHFEQKLRESENAAFDAITA